MDEKRNKWRAKRNKMWKNKQFRMHFSDCRSVIWHSKLQYNISWHGIGIMLNVHGSNQKAKRQQPVIQPLTHRVRRFWTRSTFFQTGVYVLTWPKFRYSVSWRSPIIIGRPQMNMHEYFHLLTFRGPSDGQTNEKHTRRSVDAHHVIFSFSPPLSISHRRCMFFFLLVPGETSDMNTNCEHMYDLLLNYALFVSICLRIIQNCGNLMSKRRSAQINSHSICRNEYLKSPFYLFTIDKCGK